MPVSTRQATPGPSSTVLNTGNRKKRSGSDVREDTRSAKKIKVDGDATLSFVSADNGNEKKRKRKRKRRRSSVVIPVTHSERNSHSRSKSRSVPPSSVKQPIVLSESIKNGVQTDDEDAESIRSASGKGKGRIDSRSPGQRTSTLPCDSPPSVASCSGPSMMIPTLRDSSTQDAEISCLKEQLVAQTELLERHQKHLSNYQQSLTCQICLDLMYKPYALSPCGHTTCYPCLVRWFTAPQNPDMPGMGASAAREDIDTLLDSPQAKNGIFVRRRKKCPICRAVVIDRPIVMWGVKSMVVALVRSGLAEMSTPVESPSAVEESVNTDPWRNIFRKPGAAHRFGGVFEALFGHSANSREQVEGDREQVGWYDAEDGGIYRCITCYHEIWDGVCTACRRRYPGHGGHSEEDDDEDDEVLSGWGGDVGRNIWSGPEIFDDSDDLEEEDDDDDGLPHLHLHPYLPRNPLAGLYTRHHPVHGHIAEVEDDDDEELEDGGENSEYEGSFIDDGNGEHSEEFGDDGDDDEVEVLDRLVSPPPRSRIRRRVVFDNETEDEYLSDLARRLGPMIRARTNSRIVNLFDSDSESSPIEPLQSGQEDQDENLEDQLPPASRRPRQRRRLSVDE